MKPAEARGYQPNKDFDLLQMVYHLIVHSRYGLIGSNPYWIDITCLLMAIYCHEQFNEPVSIKRIRQFKNTIQNELRAGEKNIWSNNLTLKEQKLYANI